MLPKSDKIHWIENIYLHVICRNPIVGPTPPTLFGKGGIFHPFHFTAGILSPLNFIIILLILFVPE